MAPLVLFIQINVTQSLLVTVHLHCTVCFFSSVYKVPHYCNCGLERNYILDDGEERGGEERGGEERRKEDRVE